MWNRLWSLETQNVRRLSFTGPHWDHPQVISREVLIDAQRVQLGSHPDSTVVCVSASSNAACSWQVDHTLGSSSWQRTERSPETYGPAAQVFEGPLVLIYGNRSWMERAAGHMAQDLYVQVGQH